MNLTSQRCALMASALAVSLQGCATTGGEPAALNIRPAQPSHSLLSAGGGLYGSATAAINRGDYALALDLLQAARDRGGPDARILNAFAVVYDKLGRFDLSQRYYAQAVALDPTSKIVAQNLAYSNLLQGGSAPLGLAAAAPSPALAPSAPIASARQAAPMTPQAPAVATQAVAAPPVTAPVAVVTAASPVVIARAERRSTPLVVAVRPTPALTATLAEATPQVTQPSPMVVARAASTPWEAPSILQPAPAQAPAPRVLPAATRVAAASAPSRPATAPVRPLTLTASHSAQPRPTTPQAARPAARTKIALAAAKPAALMVAPRAAALATTTRTAAATPTPAQPIPQRLANATAARRTPAHAAPTAVATAPRVARAAAAPKPVAVAHAGRPASRVEELPAPAWRGWTLAAVNEQAARVLSRGLRYFTEFERCRSGCSKVTIPLDSKPPLRAAGPASDGPSHLS